MYIYIRTHFLYVLCMDYVFNTYVYMRVGVFDFMHVCWLSYNMYLCTYVLCIYIYM